jgi:hypothetical protein
MWLEIVKLKTYFWEILYKTVAAQKQIKLRKLTRTVAEKKNLEIKQDNSLLYFFYNWIRID